MGFPLCCQAQTFPILTLPPQNKKWPLSMKSTLIQRRSDRQMNGLPNKGGRMGRRATFWPPNLAQIQNLVHCQTKSTVTLWGKPRCSQNGRLASFLRLLSPLPISGGFPALPFVVVPNPNKVRIVEVPIGKIKSIAKITLSGCACGLNGCLIVPTVNLGVAVGKGEAANIAVKNGERIHPAGIGIHMDDPSAAIKAACIGFFNKSHCFGWSINSREFFVGSHSPPASVHAVGFGITIPSPALSGLAVSCAQIAGAVVRTHRTYIRPQRTIL